MRRAEIAYKVAHLRAFGYQIVCVSAFVRARVCVHPPKRVYQRNVFDLRHVFCVYARGAQRHRRARRLRQGYFRRRRYGARFAFVFRDFYSADVYVIQRGGFVKKFAKRTFLQGSFFYFIKNS